MCGRGDTPILAREHTPAFTAPALTSQKVSTAPVHLSLLSPLRKKFAKLSAALRRERSERRSQVFSRHDQPCTSTSPGIPESRVSDAETYNAGQTEKAVRI